MNAKLKISHLLLVSAICEILFWVPVWILYDFASEREEFRIEHQELVYGFLFIPILFALTFYRFQKYKWYIKRLGSENIIVNFIKPPHSGVLLLKYTFLRFALGLFTIALMNPQYGFGTEKQETKMVEIMFALDVSRSMLAKDPGSSRDRLGTAKLAMGQFIRNLKGDRIGLVLFAGNAVLQLPVTDDYDAARLFLNNASTETVSSQGTDIGAALAKSLESFNMDNGIRKTIIIISDGEDHEAAALIQAQLAAEKDITVHTIGIGSPKGVPIPEYDATGHRTGNIRDEEGNTVLSRLNEAMLAEIAQAGNGTYTYAVGHQFGLENILEEVNKMDRTTGDFEDYSDFKDQFQYFVACGLIFLLAFILTTEKKSNV